MHLKLLSKQKIYFKDNIVHCHCCGVLFMSLNLFVVIRIQALCYFPCDSEYTVFYR